MHVGLIPDGNRRFMMKQGIKNLSNSYNLGINRFHEFLEWSKAKGVNEVTIYALSLENIKNRSFEEISTLMNVFNQNALKALDDPRIHENGLRIKVCGDIETIKKLDNPATNDMLENLEDLVEKTKDNKSMIVNLTIAYGGRQEILNACKNISEKNLEFTEENLKNELWVKDYPEIIIRTSENRLSNFLVWQSAYSEIYFVDKLWQEFSEQDYDEILADFKKEDRRFGR